MKQKQLIQKISILTASAFILFLMLLALRACSSGSGESGHGSGHLIRTLSPFERNIIAVAEAFQIPTEEIPFHLLVETNLKELRMRVPRGRPMEEIFYALQQASVQTGYELFDSFLDGGRERGHLLFKHSRSTLPDIRINVERGRNYMSGAGIISLIITGVDTLPAENRRQFLEFPHGDFIYALPAWHNRLDSIANILSRYEKEILLLLPMQSEIDRETVRSPSTIYLNDTERSMEIKIEELFGRLPKITAVAAHHGGRILENTSKTEKLFRILKRRNLIFMDMRPAQRINSHRAREIAESVKLPYISPPRHIEGKSASAIALELQRAGATSLRMKHIYIWAEARTELLEALEDLNDYFNQRGILIKPYFFQ